MLNEQGEGGARGAADKRRGKRRGARGADRRRFLKDQRGGAREAEGAGGADRRRYWRSKEEEALKNRAERGRCWRSRQQVMLKMGSLKEHREGGAGGAAV